MADDLDDVYRRIEAFVERAREEFDDRLAKWPTDLAEQEVHQVVGALLARQVTLATGLATCPPIWDGHVAPIILRAMADVYITLAWILQDPSNRCKKFIHYGLGQQKLQLEHRRADLKSRDPLEGEIQWLDTVEEWINSQRATFLTDVNLGSWSGVSSRDMADQAGCLDFYNHVYAPFSACAHSMWHHIAHYNLKQCRNPLHRYHSVPRIGEESPDPHYLYLTGKYLKITFVTFDKSVGVTSNIESAFDVLCRSLEIIGAPQCGP